MLPPDALRHTPVLTGERVRLDPLTPENGGPFIESGLDLDPELRRLTGTHATFTREQLERWVATRAEQGDRCDWVIVDRATGEQVGECALNDLDPGNASVGFRIALYGLTRTGRGYGSAAARLVLDHAFGTVGLHRVGLEVYDFNPRALRAYERVGFRREGVLRDALRWDGQWHDAVLMSVLAHELERH